MGSADVLGPATLRHPIEDHRSCGGDVRGLQLQVGKMTFSAAAWWPAHHLRDVFQSNFLSLSVAHAKILRLRLRLL